MKLMRRNQLKSLERTILTIGLLFAAQLGLADSEYAQAWGQVWVLLRLCFLLRTKMVRNKI